MGSKDNSHNDEVMKNNDDSGENRNLDELSTQPPEDNNVEEVSSEEYLRQHGCRSEGSENNEVLNLKKEIEKLKKTSEINLDKLRYLLADYDNFRKQTEKQMESKIEQARAEMLSKIISVDDDFLRAVNTLKESDCPSAILEGLNGVMRNLEALLKSEGVREIEAMGTPFDPGVHDAVSFAPSPEQPENTVVQVLRRGFMLNNKVLRPSLVILSRKIISNKEVD